MGAAQALEEPEGQHLLRVGPLWASTGQAVTCWNSDTLASLFVCLFVCSQLNIGQHQAVAGIEQRKISNKLFLKWRCQLSVVTAWFPSVHCQSAPRFDKIFTSRQYPWPCYGWTKYQLPTPIFQSEEY